MNDHIPIGMNYLPDKTDTRSWENMPGRREVPFGAMDDAQLREMAKSTGPGQYAKYTRAMLLALLNNRYRCGYVVQIEEATD